MQEVALLASVANNAFAFLTTESASSWIGSGGDGVLFAGYSTGSMRIMELIRARFGYIVLLALPRPFRKGEIFEVSTERKMVAAFTDEDAYWETAMSAPTNELQLEIAAPRDRRISEAEIVAPSGADMNAAATRRSLSVKVRAPRLSVPYRLEWRWK